MNKTLEKLEYILDTRVNNHAQCDGPKISGTEQDYDDVHIIFGEICGIAILHDYDIPSYYYMVFLVEDDDYWYIEKDINYSNFYWVNDYAKVIIKAVEYRNKLLGKESIDEDKFNKILEDAKIAFNEENNFEDIDKSFVQGMNFGFSSGFKMCYKKIKGGILIQ